MQSKRFTTPACTCAAGKAVVQVFDDFEILMHTSKGYQINFKFLFIQFGLKR